MTFTTKAYADDPLPRGAPVSGPLNGAELRAELIARGALSESGHVVASLPAAPVLRLDALAHKSIAAELALHRLPRDAAMRAA